MVTLNMNIIDNMFNLLSDIFRFAIKGNFEPNLKIRQNRYLIIKNEFKEMQEKLKELSENGKLYLGCPENEKLKTVYRMYDLFVIVSEFDKPIQVGFQPSKEQIGEAIEEMAKIPAYRELFKKVVEEMEKQKGNLNTNEATKD